jgi:hypothetical protein
VRRGVEEAKPKSLSVGGLIRMRERDRDSATEQPMEMEKGLALDSMENNREKSRPVTGDD